MTMITPSYLGETIEYSSLHACRSTLEDPTPAMSLYAPGKRTPVAPGWVDRTRQEWRAVAQSVSAVAVIGVRPIWDDEHIWDPVAASRADLWYIGDADSHRKLEERAGRRVMHVARTFGEGIGPLGRLLQVLA